MNQLTRGVSSFHASELTSPLDTLLDKRQQDVELVTTKLCKPNYHSKNQIILAAGFQVKMHANLVHFNPHCTSL